MNARTRDEFDAMDLREIGDTPLDRAIRYNANPEVRKALINAGAKPGSADESAVLTPCPAGILGWTIRSAR